MIKSISEEVQLFFCKILNLLWKYTKVMNPKTRERGLTISFMMISVSAYVYSIAPISVHLLVKCIIGVIFMSGIIFFSVDREIKKIEWDNKIFVLWFAFGILRLISGFTVSLEYLPLACVWLIGFPMIFLVWNNRGEYEELFISMYKGFMWPTIIFFVLSILFSPIHYVSYTGMTGNPNSIGQHIAAIFPMAIGKYFFVKRKNKREEIFDISFLSTCIAFAFFSSGRTIMVVMVGVVLVSMICRRVIVNSAKEVQLLKKIGKLLVGSIIITTIIFVVNRAATSVLPNYEYRYTKTPITKNDEALDKIADGFIERMQGSDKAGSSINDYSSGRINIWIETLKKFNLKGHPSKEHIYTVRNGDVGNNVHNVFLQFSYDHGVIAGGGFCLLVLYALWKNVNLILYYRDKKIFYICSLLVQVSYLGEALFTSINLPFLYEISFVYYIIYTVLFAVKGKEV